MSAANESNLEMPEQLSQWLRKIPFFAHLDDAQLRRVAGAGHMETLTADHQLLQVGENSSRLILVCAGALNAMRGPQHEVRIETGQALCTGALFDDQVVTHAVTTAEDVQLFILPREAFAELLYESMDLAAVVLQALDGLRRKQQISLLRSVPASNALTAVRRVELFADLSDPAAHMLLACGNTQSYIAGQAVLDDGDELPLILVESGRFERLESGRREPMRAGDVYGVDGLLQARRIPAQITCVQDGELVMVNRRALLQALSASAPLFTQVMGCVSHWLKALTAELAEIEGAGSGRLSGEALKARLRRSEFFRHWDATHLDALRKQAEYRHLARGDLLFAHGDPGDAMFVILNGAMQIRFHNGAGQYIDLATLREGESVGEMALIDDAPRSADAVALVDTELLCVNREGFSALLDHSPKLISALLVGLSSMLRQSNEWRAKTDQDPGAINARDAVQRVTFFNLLDSDSRNILANAGREMELAAGEVLFQEGDPADAMYVILRGSIEIVKSMPDGSERHLSKLGTGEVFGEIAMIDGQPRSAMARTRETSLFFALDREVFVSLLAQTPPLLTQVLRGLSEKVRTANQAQPRKTSMA